MSGASKYRNLWESHIKDCQAVVFVVDSSDKFRMVVAKSEIEILLKHPEMVRVPLLVFANKMDVPGALNFSQVSEQLELSEINDHDWHIVYEQIRSCFIFIRSSNALTGQGVDEGTDWVTKNAKK
jgi:ADP-ribosylation factor-like protein 6